MKKRNWRIKFHYSFIIMLALSLLFDLFWLFLIYFICLFLHECCHGYIAKKLGYKIGIIKLSFSGAILEAESDEFSFSDEIKIALAGPVFNLCFAFIIISVWWIFPESYNYTLDLCIVNLVIFAFNILPFFPLDGGRILLAFLSKKLVRNEAVKISRLITVVFSIVLFFIFIVSLFYVPAFTFGTASANLIMSVFAEDKTAVYKRCFYSKRKYERVKKFGIEARFILVNEEINNFRLYNMLDARHYTIFLLVNDRMQTMRRITETQLLEELSSE